MKRSKIVSLAFAGTLAVSALLAGTYAWQSISQLAMNEVRESGNPGGRLHVDFNFTDKGDKDVYVENFTSGNGADIYARIRIDEYMEIGTDAGVTGRNPNGVEVIWDGTGDKPELEDMNTWTTYLWERERKLEKNPAATITASDETSVFRKYVLWNQDGSGGHTTNNVTYYMPTFNKNKDSLESEINGTLEGISGRPYADHVDYASGSTETNFAVYDIDDDDTDEFELTTLPAEATLARILAKITKNNDWNTDVLLPGGTAATEFKIGYVTTFPIKVNTNGSGAITSVYVNVDKSVETSEDYDIKIVKETHTAKQTLSVTNGNIISMEKWIANGSQAGDYWVYDTDGWVYWANPIEPGGVTSLLLDKIELRSKLKNYYYATNVVAQFADRGDWGDCTKVTTVTMDGTGTVTSIEKGRGSGFYARQYGGMTANAAKLLNTIADVKTYSISLTASDSAMSVIKGNSLTLNASAAVTRAAQPPTIDYTWKVTDADGNALTSGTTLTPDTGDSSKAVLAVNAGETKEVLYVTVTAEDSNGEFAEETVAEIYVADDAEDKAVIDVSNAGVGIDAENNVVTIDGLDWYVLGEKENEDGETLRLLWATDAVVFNPDASNPYHFTDGFNSDRANTAWNGGNAENYLNSTGSYSTSGFLTTKTMIAALAEEVEIKTRIWNDDVLNATPEWDSTNDKVFLLSEADLLGVYSTNTKPYPDDYTLGVEGKLIQTNAQRKSTVGVQYWMRSPKVQVVGMVNYDGSGNSTYPNTSNKALRPAFFVNIDK